MDTPGPGSADSASILVANGPWQWCPETAASAAECPMLLAADGGANHLAEIGLRPRRVIGDLDSISEETRAWLGEECLLGRPDQDHTDLDKALSYALDELKLPRMEVFAVLGGRIDHLVSNLGLLARRRLGERLVFRGQRQLMMAVGGEVSLPAASGETWSFWTFDPAIRVSLRGVRWEVDDLPLDPCSGPSISNLATGSAVRIKAEGGAVIVLRHLLP